MNDPIISVCGHLCNDYIIAVEEYPAVGTSCRVTDRQNYYGGGAANIAVGIAKLGGTAELIAAVGRDYPGSAYEQHLKEMGVTTRLFRTDKENCSTAFMVNNAAGDQITYFEWGASALFATADAPSLSFAHMATISLFLLKITARALVVPSSIVMIYSSICNSSQYIILCLLLPACHPRRPQTAGPGCSVSVQLVMEPQYLHPQLIVNDQHIN